MGPEDPEGYLTEFGRFLDTFSTLPDLLEYSLDQATKILAAQQGSIYLASVLDEDYALELCCGACPLELLDRFRLDWNLTRRTDEAKAVQDRQMVTREITHAGTPWQRLHVPLFLDSQEKKSLGLLVFHFAHNQELNSSLAETLSAQIAKSIAEIKVLNELRLNHYARVQEIAAQMIRETEPRVPATQIVSLAAAIAEEIGLSDREVEEIKIAGFLRDVGLQGEFLSASRSLQPHEWEKVKKHPVIGEQLLLPFQFPARIQQVVRQHHESFDGSGYPDGLIQEKICLGARVLAVAETFSALISERPYRPALSPHKALSIVHDLSGSKLDPDIVSSLPIAIIRARCHAAQEK